MRCRLGEQEQECKKAIFEMGHVRPDGGAELVTITAWMPPRVLGSGLVAFEMKDTQRLIWAMKTIGYGSADGSSWGEAPSDPAR